MKKIHSDWKLGTRTHTQTETCAVLPSNTLPTRRKKKKKQKSKRRATISCFLTDPSRTFPKFSKYVSDVGNLVYDRPVLVGGKAEGVTYHLALYSTTEPSMETRNTRNVIPQGCHPRGVVKYVPVLSAVIYGAESYLTLGKKLQVN